MNQIHLVFVCLLFDFTDGYQSYCCSRCAETTATVVASTGHTAVTDPGMAPTCTAYGLTEGSHCADCNAVLIEQKTLPMLAHTYADGQCTVCGEADTTVTPFVTTDLISGYLKVTIPRYNGNEAEGTTTVEISPVLNGAFYYFALTGLTAVQMGDTVEAVLHMTKDGEKYISNTDFYSIATYAQLNKTTVSQKLRVLCAELLRYGSAAQIFKAYRTDAPVDAAMSAADRSLLRDLETVTFSNNNTILDDLEVPAVTWMGKSLDLDSRVSLKFVVNATNYKGDPQALTLRLTYVNYRGEVQTVTLEDPAIYMEGQPFYAFRFDGLLAAELRCVVDAAVYEGETRVSQTLRYSADTYGNGKTGDLLTLCKALIAYSDTALAFFTN